MASEGRAAAVVAGQADINSLGRVLGDNRAKRSRIPSALEPTENESAQLETDLVVEAERALLAVDRVRAEANVSSPAFVGSYRQTIQTGVEGKGRWRSYEGRCRSSRRSGRWELDRVTWSRLASFLCGESPAASQVCLEIHRDEKEIARAGVAAHSASRAQRHHRLRSP